ncbi:nicotinate phosphoribosyltransferase [Chelativorans xinjiangense]|uniref:nicotinate phosphoribosyltransferase n=1 Tax=Chelativorans xinjiangense TaxID=2681485 RepID=UPI001357910B|nr:nicotinate phosphoribosyltransferase [Chelativorans xinjiangense]
MTTSALFADLYEFTMLEAYDMLGMTKTAVFSLFVRKLPPERNFLVACGLDELLRDIENFRFGEEDTAYLASLGSFRPDFLERLRAFRFTGGIRAVPEGTPVFENEPILEITAPIAEAQLLETLVLNQVGHQTLIASKAERIVRAAQGRPVVDFGARRAHGYDAAIKGARAAYLAGFSASSNTEAGRRYGIPVAGTVAHSFIQAFPSEMESFRVFSRLFPNTTLLVDTYDTLTGVEAVVALAREMGPAFSVRAVRLDSGDLLELSRAARRLLDNAGLTDVQIVASGGLNEWKVERLVRESAPINMFGVGTDLLVSTDAPALDIAYKLTEYDGLGRMKLSPGKRSLPGAKQVFRRFQDGRAVGDTIALHGETLSGQPLLKPVMAHGRRLLSAGTLQAARERTKRLVAQLPESVRSLEIAHRYPTGISEKLARYETEICQRVAFLERRKRAGHAS